jgi:NifU-like protein
MWQYTDVVQEHFLNPRNVGEVENPSGTGDVGSLACGDALKLTIKVDENDTIVDARFKTFGCASAIASSSALTEMIKGMKISEAEKITNQHIVRSWAGKLLKPRSPIIGVLYFPWLRVRSFANVLE